MIVQRDNPPGTGGCSHARVLICTDPPRTPKGNLTEIWRCLVCSPDTGYVSWVCPVVRLFSRGPRRPTWESENDTITQIMEKNLEDMP